MLQHVSQLRKDLLMTHSTKMNDNGTKIKVCCAYYYSLLHIFHAIASVNDSVFRFPSPPEGDNTQQHSAMTLHIVYNTNHIL